MKKILSLMLCIAVLVCAVPMSRAAVCAHSYVSKTVYRSCITRTKTVYTCEKCGSSYFSSSPVYEKPDGFFFAADGDRDGDVLSVKVIVGNNPGLWASRLTLNYNTEALEAISCERGTVWDSTASVNINSTSGYVRFYCQNSELGDITKNGTVFTVKFKVLDVVDKWNVSLTAAKGDNVGYGSGPRTFEVINAVALGYGDHSYDDGVIYKAPTVDAYGLMRHTCTLCPATKLEKIDKLIAYSKGDVDGDGDVTMLDLFQIKLFMKQKATLNETETTAADIDGDGEVTMVDSFEIKYRIAKGTWRA